MRRLLKQYLEMRPKMVEEVSCTSPVCGARWHIEPTWHGFWVTPLYREAVYYTTLWGARRRVARWYRQHLKTMH